MEQHHLMGQWFRKRYDGFINDTYIPAQVCMISNNNSSGSIKWDTSRGQGNEPLPLNYEPSPSDLAPPDAQP